MRLVVLAERPEPSVSRLQKGRPDAALRCDHCSARSEATACVLYVLTSIS